jgi:uncharacterized protein YdhG (YjbR/CyaY superfamily)
MGVVDDYFAGFDGVTLERLNQMRQTIRDEAPDAVEVMSYGIPTFDQNGRHVVHFAGYKNHIGLYPTPHGMTSFEQELAAYPQGKGSVQFPHDQPLPLDLVRRIVRHQVALVLSKPVKRTRR